MHANWGVGGLADAGGIVHVHRGVSGMAEPIVQQRHEKTHFFAWVYGAVLPEGVDIQHIT